MSRWLVVAVALAAAAGCEKKQPRFEGPLRVDFGDCAPATVKWVSGPRPQPFTPEQATAVQVAEEDPPPPEDPPDPDGPTDEAVAQGGAFASLTGTGDISSGFDDKDIYGGLTANEVGEMQGGFGFGRSGFGPGGGGTGWGTIGTGKYGKIGSGAGTGSGYGVGGGRGGMRGRSMNVPTIALGQPNAQGDLDKPIIRRYVKRNIQKIQYCYEKELLAKAGLQGTMQVQFFITPQGNVANATATGVDKTVAECVATVIKNIEFPKPKGGGGVQVNYPFTFRPAGAATPPPTPTSAGSATGSGAGSAQPPDVDPPKPDDKPKQPPPDAYRPDANNPLVTQRAAIEECLRTNPRPHGVAVVHLDYDATGAVANAAVHGLDGGPATECVTKAAKLVKRVAKTGTAERCSLAFGDMPLDGLRAIDITSTAVTFDGKTMVANDAAMREDHATFKIAPLYDALVAERTSWKAPDAPVVAIRGPGLIRPVDTTPMKIVNLVLTTAAAAEADYSLAALTIPKPGQPSGWRPLRAFDLGLPVIPVPAGTGGRWQDPPRKSGTRSLYATLDERVHLSVLVMKDSIWVGLSRVNEFQQIKRDGMEWTALKTTLAEHKKSAFFEDRIDLELAGEDPVPYRDVVSAYEQAVAAGFTGVAVMHPMSLSARPQL